MSWTEESYWFEVTLQVKLKNEIKNKVKFKLKFASSLQIWFIKWNYVPNCKVFASSDRKTVSFLLKKWKNKALLFMYSIQ